MLYEIKIERIYFKYDCIITFHKLITEVEKYIFSR